MKKLLLLTIVVFSYIPAFATPQIPDKLIYEGKEYTLTSNYLEPYFERYPDKKPKVDNVTTALWRGYIATFEIENNEFFLKDIQIVKEMPDSAVLIELESVLHDIFPSQQRIKLDWFTGLLEFPYNKKKNSFLEYENYYLFEIDKGNIIKKKGFKANEFSKFKKLQFELLEKTGEYEKVVEQVKVEDRRIAKQLREELETLQKTKGYQNLPEEMKRGYLEIANPPEKSDREIKRLIEDNILNYLTKIIE